MNIWIENPYVQYFTGETDFQTEAPMDSSSLTRWRKRIGEEGVETLLMVSIDAAPLPTRPTVVCWRRVDSTW